MMRSRQISFTFHLAGLLVAFSHGSVVAKDSADVGVAGRVVWDPAQRSVKVTIGKQVFEHRFGGYGEQNSRSESEARPR